MSRFYLRELSVRGSGKPSADLRFGPSLTLITGPSDTGKTHVVECVDFALGSGSVPEEIDERHGYQWVILEVEASGKTFSIARAFDDPDWAFLFEGAASEWEPGAGDRIKVSVQGAADPPSTLSGRLLGFSGFESGVRILSNKRGESQNLSFRTFAPLAIVQETRIIDKESPVLSPQRTQHPASRSVFQLVLTGDAPTPEQMEEIKEANRRKEDAKQKVGVLDKMIADLRDQAGAEDLDRGFIETDLARLEEELAEVSEAVSKSGVRLRGLLTQRNAALREVEAAQRDLTRSRELQGRFELLGEHYAADIYRLDFVIEGGHFFKQITQSHCPTCGRPVDPEEGCHPESADVAAIERAAQAEKAKLAPRMKGLEAAIEDAKSDAEAADGQARRGRRRAEQLDGEIREVANPSAEKARGRVEGITNRRRSLENQLLRFRDLDRYQEARQEALGAAGSSIESYRPGQDLQALRALSDQVKSLLISWQFRVRSDVIFDAAIDDIRIDGKRRSAFGKGSRAVTHAAFAIGLMQRCFSAETPHPGFVVLDTPLTPYKDSPIQRRDPELGEGLHLAFLKSLSSLERGQVLVVENIEPPEEILGEALIHEFAGTQGTGRTGFYPSPDSSAHTPQTGA